MMNYKVNYKDHNLLFMKPLNSTLISWLRSMNESQLLDPTQLFVLQQKKD